MKIDLKIIKKIADKKIEEINHIVNWDEETKVQWISAIISFYNDIEEKEQGK